jgi:Endonuclease-reverse transcriptase
LAFARQLAIDNHVLILGDLNSHNTIWNSKSNNPAGIQVEEFLETSDFVLLNNDQYTYTPIHRPDCKSIIDLAIASHGLSATIKDFSVTDEIQTDHNTLQIEMHASCLPVEITHQTKTFVNWHLLGENFEKSCAHLLSAPLNTNLDIDQYVANLTATIQTETERSSWSKKIKHDTKFLILPKETVEKIQLKNRTRRTFQRTRNPPSPIQQAECGSQECDCYS